MSETFLKKRSYRFLVFRFFKVQNEHGSFVVTHRFSLIRSFTEKNESEEFIKCRILHFLIMECCRNLVF